MCLFPVQVDAAGGGRLLPGGVDLWRGVRPRPGLLRLDQVPRHGPAAQEDGREPAEVPVRLRSHEPPGLPAAAQGRR